MFEHNKRSITVPMMKAYPQLLRKYMSDKDKVAPLVEVITHMNLELYSLKRQEQAGSFTSLLCEFFCSADNTCNILTLDYISEF